MKVWLPIIVCLLAALSVATPVDRALAQSGEIVTPDQPLADAAQEARARKLMKEIRCVVCQSQSIDESEAGIAHDMRQIVRTQIAGGKSDAEIRDYLTARYGDFVLLKPPFKPVTLVLWLGPFALIALAGFGVFMFYRRSSAVAAAALSPAERARVAAFLKDGGAEDPSGGGAADDLLWLICGLMTLAAAVILALPLFDARKLKNDSAFALEVYRDQLSEINRDATRGILDHDQAKAAQVEIERRILALAEAPMFKPARAPSHGLMIALAVVLPLSGFGLYLLIGQPGLPGAALADRDAAPPPATTPALAALEQAVAGQPNDTVAWIAYAEGLMQAERPGDAANAFAKAIALGANGPQVQGRYGAALVLAANGAVEAKARAAFQAALAVDPTDPTSRFFLALAKEQAGDGEAALTDWLALERELPADTPWRPDLVTNIDRLATQLGKDPKTLPGRPAPSEAAREGDPSVIAGMSPEEQQQFINSMVERLAERLKTTPDDLEGWIKLARAYGVLKRTDEAATAWGKAAALAPGQLELQVEYANALIEGRSNLDRDLPPTFVDTVTRIRTLAPENPLGLYYGGLVSRVKGDKDGARVLWEKVLALLPPNSPQRDSLQREIKSLDN